jgi:hypothetical protein
MSSALFSTSKAPQATIIVATDDADSTRSPTTNQSIDITESPEASVTTTVLPRP